MSEREAILFANTTFYAAFTSRDYEAMDRLWARGEVGCIHPGWPPLSGRGAVMNSWRNILGNEASPDVSARKPTVLIRDRIGIVLCLEIVKDREGGPAQALSATNVFVKEADGWRMAHHQAGLANVDADKIGEEKRPPMN